MIIGRENELLLLHEAYRSEYSEFVAVYGRRRVGKTFLIREAFNYKFTFQHSGLANSSKDEQLAEWQISLEKHGMKDAKLPKNWREAFSMLDNLIRHSRAKKKSYSWTNSPGWTHKTQISSPRWNIFGMVMPLPEKMFFLSSAVLPPHGLSTRFSKTTVRFTIE